MISAGRMAAIATVALGVGFVGGVWFIGSGVGFQLIPAPKPAPTPAKPRRPPPAPRVKAVAVPEPVKLSGGSVGLEPRADRTDLLPAPGCDWAIEPRPFRLGRFWQATNPERALGGYPSVDPTSGGLRYLLIQSTPQGGFPLVLRPVFFDAEANRQAPRGGGGGTSRGSGGMFMMSEFHLDPIGQLAPEKVAYFGIERVSPDAARLLVEAAQKEAKAKGMAILPPLRLGAPYPFDLPTADGQRIRTGDFRGKAVLVVAWAPDGFGGIALMTVKRAREANAKDELAIVGVSFDGSVEDARKSFARSGADGPLVVIPNDPTSRRIWSEGAQIERLPAFLLIDREGILRFTCNSFELQDRIDILFGRARRPRYPTPVRIIRPAPKASTAPTPPPSPRPGT